MVDALMVSVYLDRVMTAVRTALTEMSVKQYVQCMRKEVMMTTTITRNSSLSERDLLIYRMRQYGLPLEKIATCFDVSIARIGQICARVGVCLSFTPKQVKVMHAAQALADGAMDIDNVINRYGIWVADSQTVLHIAHLIEQKAYLLVVAEIRKIKEDS